MYDYLTDKEYDLVKFLVKTLCVLVSLFITGITIGIIMELGNLNNVAKSIIIFITCNCSLIYILHTINLFKKIK